MRSPHKEYLLADIRYYKIQIQPPIQPRPDVASLGITYRRIPLLAIGRDVYLDTRLILQRLESLPALASDYPKLGAAEGTEHRAIERLLSTLVNEAGVFPWSVAMFPPTLPVFKDERFMKDRSEFMGAGGAGGRQFGPASAQARAEAATNLRGVFALLEHTFLADGRDWILGGSGSGSSPGLADIEAVWTLHWLRGIPGALPKEVFSVQHFPRVFAWIERFDKAAKAAAQKVGKVPAISGAEATRTIVEAKYVDGAEGDSFGQVVPEEPVAQALKLQKGDRVVVYPVDTGSTHKDVGRLLSLDGNEVIFETRAAVDGTPAVRVHAPRIGFRVVREDQVSHL